MKVVLLRDSRIMHKAGEVVEVSPAERDFLVPLGSAVDAVTKPVEPVEEAVNESVETKKKSRKK